MFEAGDTFFTKHNQKGKVSRIATMNEFGLDLHHTEINYVVEFDNNILPIATYNVINSQYLYDYVMNINDMYSSRMEDVEEMKTKLEQWFF